MHAMYSLICARVSKHVFMGIPGFVNLDDYTLFFRCFFFCRGTERSSMEARASTKASGMQGNAMAMGGLLTPTVQCMRVLGRMTNRMALVTTQ